MVSVMMHSRVFTARNKELFLVLIALAVTVVSGGLVMLQLQSQSAVSNQSPELSRTTTFGFVYLPVTRNVSEYYGLGVDCGAMVTEIEKGGLLDQAGIRVGDVIVSLNGFTVTQDTPLLGLIRSCPEGDCMTMEVWSHGDTREVIIIQVATHARGHSVSID